MITGILFLNSIEFQENELDGNSGCLIPNSSQLSLNRAAELLSVDLDELKQAMSTHIIQVQDQKIKY